MTLHELLQACDGFMHVPPPRVAVFASGGGAPGIDILAGYLLAMERRGIQPCAWSGTSAGAVAGLMYASPVRSAASLATILRSLPPDAVQSPRIGGWARTVLFNSSVNSNDKALATLRRYGSNSYGLLNQAGMELRMWSTVLTDGYDDAVDTTQCFDDPCEAALASMSAPFLLPPVRDRDGHLHQDGGVVFNAPVIGEWLDTFDHCFLLIAQDRRQDRPLAEKPTALDSIIHIVRSGHHALIENAVRGVAGMRNVTVLWIDTASDSGLLTFDHDNIDRADAYATKQLTTSY